MVRPVLVVCALVLAVSFVIAQEQVTKEIPLWHISALETAALFSPGPAPAPPPPPEPLEQVALRTATRVVADVAHTAWRWQSFVEVSPGIEPRPAEPVVGGGMSKLLPGNMAPPVALLWRNSLKVTGTADEISKFREILALLDKPAVRIGLDVSVLSLEPERAKALPGVDWSSAVGDNADERLRSYFARGDTKALLADCEANPTPLTTTLTVSNNATAIVTFIEAMPFYVRQAENGPDELLTRVRVLRLTLTPRRNADDSITVHLKGDYYAGRAAGERPGKMAEEGRWLANVETQVRLGAGESALLRGVGTDSIAFGSESVEFGPQHLLHPLLVITPRTLPAEEAYLCDAGPLEGDIKDRMLNTIFGKALRDGVDGTMAGLDDEGYTMVWFQTAPNQWEPAMKLPLFMLGPIIHLLADPADANGRYVRKDPTGPELDITVTRQQVGGRPGVVLTWPRK